MGNTLSCACEGSTCEKSDPPPIPVYPDSGQPPDFQKIKELVQAAPHDAVPEQVRKAFVASITRVGPLWDNIGLTVSPDDDPAILTVDDVEVPSLVSEWNEEHDWDEQVSIGDSITDVNGTSGDALRMYEAIQACGKGSTINFRINPK
mmetsp:Transcript_72702/g.115088  ORF Transcript_72702/g.115088 Transcript_72702/m.115088 type:complete len:148 (+) Transcript_72702:48-491(+)